MSENGEVIEGEVTTLAVREQVGMVLTPSQAKAQLQQLQEFVASVMVEGTGLRSHPGMGNKKTLLKPGAEKLNEVYGYAPYVEVLDKIEDWHSSPRSFQYTIKCILRNKRTDV